MNSLSWMIYLADVSSGIVNTCIASCVIGALSMLVVPLALDGYDEKESRGKWMKRIAAYMIVAAVVAVFLPSGRTIYAIAASEYGEEVLKTPEASKARQALNAWLDKQIGEQKPEKSK